MAKVKAKSIRTDILGIPALQAGEGLSGSAIAAALGRKTLSTRSTIFKMVRDNQLQAKANPDGCGYLYSIPPPETALDRLNKAWVPTRIPAEWRNEAPHNNYY